MREFFLCEWHNIRFSTFAETSAIRLADAGFYNKYYCALFDRYSGYDALDAHWRKTKEEAAEWIASNVPDGGRVLSVGCGLGYMEQYLWRNFGRCLELHVQDYASEAHRWLRKVMPADHIHSPEDSGELGRYDLIYLSAVDYAMPDAELVGLLGNLRPYLREGGTIALVSASYLDDSWWRGLVHSSKDVIKSLLAMLGCYERGQFWGWMRSRSEYRAVMAAAGCKSIDDGFIVTPHQRTYWIRGRTTEKSSPDR